MKRSWVFHTLRVVAACLMAFVALNLLIVLPMLYHKHQANKIRPQAMQHVIRQVQPLIAAIEAYRSKEGRLPSRLEYLVPRYLSQIPSPGPTAESGWFCLIGGKQITDNGKHRFFDPYPEGDRWILGIRVRRKYSPQLWGFGDTFVYHSDGRYSRLGYGGGLGERIGDWAYYYE